MATRIFRLLGLGFIFTFVFALSARAQSVWVGTTSTNWNDATNWSPVGIPNSGTDVQVNTKTPNIATLNGQIGNAASVTIANGSGDDGEIDVINGSLTTPGAFMVGRAGTGVLSASGSTVQVTNGENMVVGSQSNSMGTATIDASDLLVNGQLRVGDSGTGSFTLDNSTMILGGRFVLGTLDGSSGTAVFTDVSLGIVSGTAVVGDAGTGTLTLQNGSSLFANEMRIGDNVDGTTNGTGTVTVTGTSGSTHSLLNVTNVGEFIDVGGSGTGTLNVLAGGEVDAYRLRIGRDAGSTGDVTVDGVGSTLTTTRYLAVGGTDNGPGGQGTLTITNHGVVNVGTDMYVWGPSGRLVIDSTYTLTVAGTLTFDNGILDFKGTGANFINPAFLGNTVLMGGIRVDVAGSDVGTISGQLSGPGGLNKESGGTLILINSHTYTGDTVVDEGTLQLDGTIVSQTIVDSNATLTGTGTINTAGIQNIDGVVSPGHGGIGTLSAEGTYQQNSFGTLQIGVAGTGANEHGMLNVGQAQLDGTLNVLRLNNFSPANGDRVTIINDVPGGHSGTFSTVTSTFPGLIQPVPFYDEANDVYILFQLSGTFVSEALTRNQRSVAANIDNVVNDPRAAGLIAFLGSEPGVNLPNDYDLIAPEELASIYEIGFSQAVVMNQNLIHRMDDIRAGSTGYSGPVVQIPTGKDEAPISDKNVATKNVAPVFAPCPDNRWGVFAVGSGDFATVGNGDDNASGYSISNGTMLVGVDYRFGNHFAVGIDGEYANDIAELVNRGRVYADGGKIGGFATAYGKGWLGSTIYIDAAGGAGWNSYETRRTGLQGEIAHGDTDGMEWNGMLAYGSDWTFGQWTFGTWSSLQYTDVQFNGFTEEGSLAPLEFPDQDEDSFRATSGIRASYSWKFGNCGFIRPEARAAWQHEYGDRSYPIDSRLASGAGDIFRVWGPTVGRDAALIDAGVTWQFNSCFGAFAFYDGVVGRDNYSNHAVSGGMKVNF